MAQSSEEEGLLVGEGDATSIDGADGGRAKRDERETDGGTTITHC